MKKTVIIVVVLLVLAAVAVALWQFTDLFNFGGGEELGQPNARIMGEVFSVDGNVITLNEVAPPGGMGGRVLMGGGGQGGQQGERVMVTRDGGDEADGDEGEFVGRRVTLGEDGEVISAEGRPARMAGADPEADRIRIAEDSEDGEDGRQVVVFGGGEGGISMPNLQYTGNVREVTAPRGMQVTRGFGDNEELVSISTLERGEVVVITYDEEGKMDSIRVMPNVRIGNDVEDSE